MIRVCQFITALSPAFILLPDLHFRLLYPTCFSRKPLPNLRSQLQSSVSALSSPAPLSAVRPAGPTRVLAVRSRTARLAPGPTIISRSIGRATVPLFPADQAVHVLVLLLLFVLALLRCVGIPQAVTVSSWRKFSRRRSHHDKRLSATHNALGQSCRLPMKLLRIEFYSINNLKTGRSSTNHDTDKKVSAQAQVNCYFKWPHP